MKSSLEKRFHELLVLDCRGKATPTEKRKLAILEKMRECEPSAFEKRQIPRLEWNMRQMRKTLGRLNHLQFI